MTTALSLAVKCSCLPVYEEMSLKNGGFFLDSCFISVKSPTTLWTTI